MALIRPPMTWNTHPTVIGRWRLDTNAACTLERVPGHENLFYVKRWASGYKVGQTAAGPYELAVSDVNFLRKLVD